MTTFIGNYECIKELIDNTNNLEIDILNWLKNNNILPSESILIYYNENVKWQKNGTETYINECDIEYKIDVEKINKKLVFKALTTINPSKSTLDWYRRRELLSENNIPVSKWYYCKNALIIEDYYEWDYKSVNNEEKLNNIGIILDKMGFHCLNYLEDIRCDTSGNPFYVDFGFDLGEPQQNKTNNICKITYDNYINKLK